MVKKAAQRKSAGARSSEAAPRNDFSDARKLWNDTPAEHKFVSLVPDGVYPVEIVGGELVRSSKKKTPCYEVNMRITGDSVYNGRGVVMKLWFTKESAGRSKWFLNQLGFMEFDQLQETQPTAVSGFAEVVVKSSDDWDREWNEVCELYLDKGPTTLPLRAAGELMSPHVETADRRASA